MKLFCYNHWGEYLADSEDVDQLFASLESSIRSRLEYSGTIGISMSGGIDSGIIAFMADKLNVQYHIFSVIEMFGEKTEETDAILERINRLKNASGVSLLRCNEEQYQKALNQIYLPNYYDSEKFDTGNIPTHTVFEAMKKQNIRVAIDGTGGDELFHGYNFRDQFKPVEGWPQPWKNNNFFYSLFTTLLDYTAKDDRAGAFFSIETRFPYQCVAVMKEALKLRHSHLLKWPLRKLLLEYLDYGKPTSLDLNGKVGFDLKNRDKQQMLMDMSKRWCQEHSITSLPTNPPKKFPFKIGIQYS
jgi:asparagine synthetase B (glutamine-hydrolysing)